MVVTCRPSSRGVTISISSFVANDVVTKGTIVEVVAISGIDYVATVGVTLSFYT